MSKQIYTLPSGVRVTAKGYRQWRKDEGLCRNCTEPVAAPRSATMCERHLITSLNNSRGYRTATGHPGRDS